MNPEINLRLVSLRVLLGEALARVADQSALGRHTAIILLDGACEQALGIAADVCGVDIGRTFPDTCMNLRRHLGASWLADGWPGVRTAHRARNEAQHHGIVPDAQQLQLWSADALRFVRGLIGATHDLNLDEVALADAISDSELSTRLADAECSLQDGRAPESVAASRAALQLARERWQAQRTLAGQTKLSPAIQLDNLTSPIVTDQLGRLDDVLEVLPFASDIGEYLWFRTLPDSPPPAPQATVEQASRALSFVFSWIIRWEAFSARYDAAERRNWFQELRPPRSDHPELGIRVTDIRVAPIVQHVGQDPHPAISVTFQVVDAPADDFDGWLRDVQRLLQEGAGGLYTYASIGRDGGLTMTSATAEIDPASVREAVQSALDDAEEARVGRAERHDQWHADHASVWEAVRDALMPLTDAEGRGIFASVELVPMYPPNLSTEPPPPKVLAVWAKPNCPAYRDPHFTREIWAAVGYQYDIGGGSPDRPAMAIPTTEDPTIVAQHVQRCYRASEERAAAWDQQWAAHAARTSEMERKLRRVFTI